MIDVYRQRFEPAPDPTSESEAKIAEYERRAMESDQEALAARARGHETAGVQWTANAEGWREIAEDWRRIRRLRDAVGVADRLAASLAPTDNL